MNDIPAFQSAVASFQRFLVDEGHPSEILWVFREDVWQRPVDILLRRSSQIKNQTIAEKVFEEGRRHGLVQVNAIATVEDKVVATVWFPKFAGEEVQGWSQGMKLSIAKPLPRAKFVGELRWLAFRLHPKFRHYQRHDVWIGTKAWANAQPGITKLR